MATYVQIHKCIRCKHRWIPRKSTKPKKCPKCKNPWDRKGRGLGWRKGISNIKDADVHAELIPDSMDEAEIIV